jgi:hypothetical protein
MAESERQNEPANAEEVLRREQQLHEVLAAKLARNSRRSAIIGFVGGAVVVAGLAATFVSSLQTNNKLTKQVDKNTELKVQVTTTSADAAKATQEASTVKTVLGATMQDLQNKGAGVSSTATAAINHAFDSDPEAAKLLTRVYIHMGAQSQHKRATEIAKALRTAGFLVPGIDVQPYPAGAYATTQVHYYTSDTQSLSDANAIQKAVAATGIPVIVKQAFPKDKQPEHSYGLWLAVGLQ